MPRLLLNRIDGETQTVRIKCVGIVGKLRQTEMRDAVNVMETEKMTVIIAL